MIYRPREPWALWDSWLFEWREEYHLYFLETHETTWDYVGHAVSADLLHWMPRPSIRIKGGSGDWNENALNAQTGMVVRHDGRFYMFVGANYGPKSYVGVYLSDDLDNWTPYHQNPVMCAAPPHYITKAPAPQCPRADWRDPCINYCEKDGYYHAFLFARRSEFTNSDSGGVVGHLRSKDLVHWEHMPPVEAPTGRFYMNEVPDIFEFEGNYYLLFSTFSSHGFRHTTPSRDKAFGTFYMIANSPYGPYELPNEYMLIGAGCKITSYVGRTIPYKGGRLFYHQISANRPTWGLPKRIARLADSSLYLKYLPIIDKIEKSVVFRPGECTPCFDINDLGVWNRGAGRITGKAIVAGSSCRVASEISDLHFFCNIRLSFGARAGVALRVSNHKAVHVLLDFQQKRMEIVRADRDRQYLAGWDDGWEDDGHAVDICRLELNLGRMYSLRCLVRDEHFEVYLDDRWIFTSVLADASKSGDVELTVERGQATFCDMRLATLEPLA